MPPLSSYIILDTQVPRGETQHVFGFMSRREAGRAAGGEGRARADPRLDRRGDDGELVLLRRAAAAVVLRLRFFMIFLTLILTRLERKS